MEPWDQTGISSCPGLTGVALWAQIGFSAFLSFSFLTCKVE